MMIGTFLSSVVCVVVTDDIQVLTSTIVGEEDATLAYQLEALYRAFRFYNGSFADVFEVSVSAHTHTHTSCALPRSNRWANSFVDAMTRVWCHYSKTRTAHVASCSRSFVRWDRC
jgi:hypothetical protein